MSEEINRNMDEWKDEWNKKLNKEHSRHKNIGIELKSVVLTKMEFTLLASIAGLERFCGMEIEPSLPESQEEMWELVAEMIQKGDLVVLETGEETAEEEIEAALYLKRAFHILKECRQMAVFYPGREEAPSTCIYPSESGKILMIQNSNINEKELRLSVVSREEMWDFVWESFAEIDVTLTEGEDNLDMETQPFDRRYRDAGQLCRRGDVFLVADKIDTNSGEIEGRCLLTEEEILPWLIIQEQGMQKKVHPSRQTVREFLELKDDRFCR